MLFNPLRTKQSRFTMNKDAVSGEAEYEMTGSYCEPFFEVNIKVENVFEEDVEKNYVEDEEGTRSNTDALSSNAVVSCNPCTEINIKNESISDREEDHQEMEVDLGSLLSTEIVKQDPDEEFVSDSFTPAKEETREGVEDPLGIGKKNTESDKLQFECDICKKTFGLLFLLVAHKRIHAPEAVQQTFECDICKKTFLKKSLLVVHLYTHAGERPHACDVCDKTFVQSSALKEHKLTHKKDKPFGCDRCPCWFTRLYALHVHMRTHSGDKPYECDLCHKRFAKSSSLTRHRRTHSSCRSIKRSKTKFKVRQSYLSLHSRIQCKEKPIQCEYCNRGFTESVALKLHIRTHTGEKPYECEICERKFTRMSGLTKHKAVHGKEKS